MLAALRAEPRRDAGRHGQLPTATPAASFVPHFALLEPLRARPQCVGEPHYSLYAGCIGRHRAFLAVHVPEVALGPLAVGAEDGAEEGVVAGVVTAVQQADPYGT